MQRIIDRENKQKQMIVLSKEKKWRSDLEGQNYYHFVLFLILDGLNIE